MDTVLDKQTNAKIDDFFGDEKQYSVIFHNDDVTPFEFVIMVVMEIFGKSMEDAIQFAFFVHTHGSGTAGIYDRKEAYEKADAVDALKSDCGFDLLVTVEEAE